MADRLAGGRLAEILLEHKREGHSLDHSARLLYAEYGIEVTRQTVAVWLERAQAVAADLEAESA